MENNNNAADDGIPFEGDGDMCLGLPKDDSKFKFNFVKKFAAKTGSLSRHELEELLIQKIAESIKFRTNNTELRERLKRHDRALGH